MSSFDMNTCAPPGLIGVSSEGEKLVEHDLAAPEVDHFGLRQLHNAYSSCESRRPVENPLRLHGRPSKARFH